MPEIICYPLEHPDHIWPYCPTYSAAIAFSVLFGLATLGHTVQAIVYRKPFAIVLIVGAVWETVGYILRTLSVLHQTSTAYYVLQQYLIILSPLWINAFVYMLLARMIHYFYPPKRDIIFRLRARRVALVFVLFDIAAFLVQMAGGSLINPELDQKINDIGVKVYMAGVGLQLFFICLFMSIAVQFYRTMSNRLVYFALLGTTDRSEHHEDWEQHQPIYLHRRPLALRLLYTIYFTLFLIVFRNIYRLIEFSSGAESHITSKEYYTFIFDTVPMLLAFLAFNVCHPGVVLQGDRKDFREENRELKMLKKAKKHSRGDKIRSG